jgi:hypothetical protein
MDPVTQARQMLCETPCERCAASFGADGKILKQYQCWEDDALMKSLHIDPLGNKVNTSGPCKKELLWTRPARPALKAEARRVRTNPELPEELAEHMTSMTPPYGGTRGAYDEHEASV